LDKFLKEMPNWSKSLFSNRNKHAPIGHQTACAHAR
jgi:hypothetical protein